jgi:Fe-S-cluster-containing dehydrogenase component
LLGRLGEQVPSEFGVDAISDDLLAHPGESLVVAGHRQPLEVHLLAHLINAATGAYGKTVEFVADAAVPAASIRDLAKQLKAGSVDTLVILGANPSYNAPADLDWNVTIDSAKSVIRLADQEDESFASATYHLPQAHYLESWGDARTSDGTLVAVQPLIAPLHGGVTELEVLARILGETSSNPHDIAQATFNSIAKTGGTWKNFLHDGFLAGTASKTVSARVNANDIYGKLKDARVPSAPSADALEIVFARDYSVDDGRYGNNGWLQELPDPVTKMVWDNPVMISRATAVELGLENTDNVTITVDGREVAGAIWVQPGMAEGVIGLPLGYGRTKGGRIANFGEKLVGFNAYKIRTSAFPHISAGAKLGKAEAKYEFASAQEHWAIHGRPIVREANLAQYHKKPDFAKNMGIEAHAKDAGPIYKSPYEDESKKHLKSDLHQWAMSIDLSTCVGCSACVIACQSENNIPIVGKDQVLKRREMHGLRIDRYYTGDPGTIDKEDGKFGVYKDEDQWKHTWIDDPQVVNQPMMCQHCENAPCESVCPVNATAHDTEGLNVMAYNRCVGTRYCSNNCSWKVRRFNWFDYNKRPTDKLYNNNITDFLGLNLNERSDDEMDLLAMARNPDVTVRMRGVMEKCTFCVQRIEQAKIAQKVEAKDSDDVRVKDGAIKTACQQVCPADSIVFGNLLDEDSKVSQLKLDERNYAVLGFLDTKPRVTYLAKVRNPNPAMPGYRDAPLGLDEYRYKHGDPMVSHHGDDHAKEGSSH